MHRVHLPSRPRRDRGAPVYVLVAFGLSIGLAAGAACKYIAAALLILWLLAGGQ